MLASKCQLAGWDVSRDTIDRIEAQARKVSDFELKIMRGVLKVTVNTLLGIKD